MTTERKIKSAKKTSILDEPLKFSADGRLPRTTVTKTSFKFDVDPGQATNIFITGLQAHGNSQPVELHSGRKGTGRRKRIDILSKDREIQKMQSSCRTNNRRMILALGILETTLNEHLENLGINVHYYQLKRYLTEKNIKERVRWTIK